VAAAGAAAGRARALRRGLLRRRRCFPRRR
jgi:hypothetical protein